ncbi:hypothetical protein [Parasutterella excrementihominis]|uniref:hypothetical protein n=1 Tax=Parasutterella excrementihominis TaxID=487175 RepID=UPI003AB286D2
MKKTTSRSFLGCPNQPRDQNGETPDATWSVFLTNAAMLQLLYFLKLQVAGDD